MPKSHLKVSLLPCHDRRPHPSDEQIEAAWQAKLAKATASGGRLFDASKFRLHRISSGLAADSVEVEIGLTSYQEYVGTNLLAGEKRAALEADGERSFGDACAHLSNALGCEAVLVTADGYAVLLRRSGAVATGTGLYNGPSGHAEPSHAKIPSHAPSDNADAARAADARATEELYSAILQEVHEETNVPLAALSPPLLIGAMEDSTRKPDLLFLTRTSLDAEGVRAAYAQGASEGWESSHMAFRPASGLVGCVDLPLTSVTRAAAACLAMLDEF